MRLLRLHITGFGKLREQTIEFGPGITLLLGPNEAGKSTVLHCLAQVLLGKPTQRSLFPDMTPWDGGPFAAALEFEIEENRYRLTRRFSDSGVKAQTLHRLLEDGSEALVTQEAAEIRKWVATAFGTADDRLFYRVFYLSQADLNPLDNYNGLREQLEKVTAGADVTVAAAITRIDERLLVWRRGVNQPALKENWGALKRAADALQSWEARLHAAARDQRKLEESRTRMTMLQGQLADGATRQAEISAVLEHDRERRGLQSRLDELKGNWATLETERERREKLEADHQRLLKAVADIPADIADTDAVRIRLATAESDAARRARLQRELEQTREKAAALPDPCRDTQRLRARIDACAAPGLSPLLGWSLIAGGVVVGAILALALRQPLWFSLAALGVLFGLPLLLTALKSARQRRAFLRELGVDDLDAARTVLFNSEETQRDLAGIERLLGEMAGGNITAEEIATLRARVEEVERLRMEFDAATRALAALTPAEEIAARRTKLSLEVTGLEETLRKIPGDPLPAAEASRLTAELSTLNYHLPGWQAEERTLSREVAVLEEAERDLVDLEDGVAYWRQEQARAKEEEQALQLARELLVEAGEQAHGTLADPLATRIAPLYAAMTGGKYPTVQVEGDAKSFQVHPLQADGTPVDPEQLSRGARDQFILAVRLALGEVIAGEEGTPIFLLDDPLLHFDETRRTEALTCLRQMAERSQVVLATHDSEMITCLPNALVVTMAIQPTDSPLLADAPSLMVR